MSIVCMKEIAHYYTEFSAAVKTPTDFSNVPFESIRGCRGRQATSAFYFERIILIRRLAPVNINMVDTGE